MVVGGVVTELDVLADRWHDSILEPSVMKLVGVMSYCALGSLFYAPKPRKRISDSLTTGRRKLCIGKFRLAILESHNLGQATWPASTVPEGISISRR